MMANMFQALRDCVRALRKGNFQNNTKMVACISTPIQVQQNIFDWDLISNSVSGEQILVFNLAAAKQEKYVKKTVQEVAMGF